MATTIPTEYLLTTDEFNNPKVLQGKDAISQLLIHLILLEPGTYASRPTMGVGLVSRYRYTSEENLDVLKQDIEDQISTYLPEFSGVKVTLELDAESQLIINIEINGTIYKYETSKQEDNNITLTDLSL